MSHRTDTAPLDDRPLWTAIGRGLRCRCPRCGEAQILHRYLKVHDACPACGEDLSHQRADDGPAYLTILVVGHILAPTLLISYTLWQPAPWVTIAVFGTGCVALSLALLPRFKGLFVSIQWANRMHGFGED